MDNKKTLTSLADGEIGRILSVQSCSELKRRLMDLGFIEGTRIRRLFGSSCGDPVAYLVRGRVIVLRNGDSARILIK